jgi:hypothetical protein
MRSIPAMVVAAIQAETAIHTLRQEEIKW